MTVDYDDLDERSWASPSNRMKPLTKPFKIAGVQFQDLSGFSRPPGPIKDVRLNHNPQNRFDPFAVEVHVGAHMIGHIPRTELVLLHHLAQTIIPKCEIVEYDPDVQSYDNMFRAVLLVPDDYVLKVGKIVL